MVNIQRIPDDSFIVCENGNTDATLRYELTGTGLEVYLTADKSLPRYVSLRWNHRTSRPARARQVLRTLAGRQNLWLELLEQQVNRLLTAP